MDSLAAGVQIELRAAVACNPDLTVEQRALLHDRGRVFLPTSVVRVIQLDAPLTWNADHGSTMQAQPGDWLVQSEGDTWSVEDGIFRVTYEHLRDDLYRKVTPVLAVELPAAGTVLSREGMVEAEQGDLLVCNVTGECWSMPKEKFFQRYAVVGS